MLATIPLNKIRENPVALRTVDRTTARYLGLVDSIKVNGVLNAIVVREIKDPETGEPLYGLIDGLQRFTASGDAGKTEINANVVSMETADTMVAQVVLNLHKIETLPVEYSKQLIKILGQNPLMTKADLCKTLSCEPGWLGDRLSLGKLNVEIGKLVDGGDLNLSNAYALAKLPEEEQAAFVDRAMAMQPGEFIPTVSARVKEIRDAKRAGRDTAPAEFVTVAHVRKIGELKTEYDAGTIGPALIREEKVTTAHDGFKLGIAWALHLDSQSVAAAKVKDSDRKAKLKADKEKRDKERDVKALEANEKKAAELRAKFAGQAVPEGVAVG